MKLCAKAMAKINLTLDVLGRRDDGYHEIKSVMQSVSLCDTVTATVSQGSGITVSCGYGSSGFKKDNGRGNEDIPCGPQNTAYKAAAEFMKAAGIEADINIRIEKNIPAAAGLGGGSADAAAVLELLNAGHDAPLNNEQLMRAALAVGADVPFCLSGGTALVEGIGEEVTRLVPLNAYPVVIVKKGKKPSTGEMYARLDSLADMETDYTGGFIQNYRGGLICGASGSINNTFRRVYDEDQVLLSIIEKSDPIALSLSGAGPCVFGIFNGQGEAKSCYSALHNMGYEAYLCHTCAAGVDVLS